MKLRVRNEDFVVKEICGLVPARKGEFGIYVLRKVGWNTVDALAHAANAHGVPYLLFSYGGRKDRHALTEQVITVRSTRDLSMKTDGYSLKFLGWSHRPMGPDMVQGNSFGITLRSLSAEEGELLLRREPLVRRDGFSNFFDDQRFGSMDRTRGFLAERLLKGHWNGALQMYLAPDYVDESPEQRERRERYSGMWGRWQELYPLAKTEPEKWMLEILSKEGKNYLGALQKIPREELSFLFAVYQASLWNEMLRIWLSRQEIALGSQPGDAGPYLFYGALDESTREKLLGLHLPTAGPEPVFPSGEVEALYDSLLAARGIDRSNFNLRRLRQAYFKSGQRPAVVFAGDLRVQPPAPDDLYKDRLKAVLEFTLPSGSYATMLTKALLTNVPDQKAQASTPLS